MTNSTKKASWGRNSQVRGVFLLFSIGMLACVAESELSIQAGGEPTPGAATAPVIGQPTLTLAAEPELFVLLSTDDDGDAMPETTLGDIKAMPPLSADRHNGVASEHMERIRQKATTKSISLAKVDLNAFKENHLQMALSASKKLRASKKHVEALGANSFIWTGEVPGAAAMSTFVVRDGNVTGSVRDENNVLYSIEPVGDGVHAVTQIDESGFAPEIRLVPDETLPNTQQGYAASPSITMDAGTVEIDVLVAYTPSARRARNDMDSLIRLAIEETNQTYKNSNINIRLNLVDSFEHNYTEQAGATGWERTLNDFTKDATVASRRNSSGADVAMLIINDRTYCGMAWVYSNANANYAFGLVEQSCATGHYTFAHEIGHIQGASHNEHIENRPVFSYGHGYIYSVAARTNNFSTVMSYDFGAGCSYGCARIPYWSNPNISYKGIPTGTVSTNNNARVLNETAAKVSAYRARQTGNKPSCTLSADVASIPQGGGTYTLRASCSDSPSSYTWTVNNGAPQTGGSSLSYNFPANNSSVTQSFSFSLTATNAAGTSNPVQLTLNQAGKAQENKPSCTLSANVASIPQGGAPVTISSSCSGNPSSYVWTVNNGAPQAGGSSFSYNVPANTSAAVLSFSFSLTASNGAGASEPARLTLNQAADITEPIQTVPVCELVPTATIPSSGGPYSIGVNCKPEGTSHRWSVNEELQNSTGKSILYNFPPNETATARSFIIIVTARNNAGEGAPVQMIVNQPAGIAEGAPSCRFSAETATVPALGGSYYVRAICEGTPSSHEWYVNGIKQRGTGNPIIYTFPANNTSASRTFNISVRAANRFGNGNTAQLTVFQDRIYR